MDLDVGLEDVAARAARCLERCSVSWKYCLNQLERLPYLWQSEDFHEVLVSRYFINIKYLGGKLKNFFYWFPFIYVSCSFITYL